VTEGRDLTGRTMLVTGVTSGIALETMRVLALRGLDLKLHDVDIGGALHLADKHGVTFYEAS
jgi:NAD(P)-dependent dehydrogenase (short-subunit alcohol dehydrogenase family)